MGVHSCGKNKLSSRPAGEIKVWIKPFQRFAGSQGSALSRPSQRAKSPIETRDSARVSTKLSFQARPAGRKTLLRAKRAHEKRLKRFSHSGWHRTLAVSFPEQPGGLETILRRRTKSSFKKGTENQRMDNLRFSSIAKRYATGISFTVRSKIAYRRSPRVRTPAAYFKAHSRPFGNPFFRSPFMAWPNKSATALRENAPPGRFLIPQGGGKVRTPHGGSVQCGAPCCAGITDLQRGFWDNCESSTGFV